MRATGSKRSSSWLFFCAATGCSFVFGRVPDRVQRGVARDCNVPKYTAVADTVAALTGAAVVAYALSKVHDNPCGSGAHCEGPGPGLGYAYLSIAVGLAVIVEAESAVYGYGSYSRCRALEADPFAIPVDSPDDRAAWVAHLNERASAGEPALHYSVDESDGPTLVISSAACGRELGFVARIVDERHIDFHERGFSRVVCAPPTQ